MGASSRLLLLVPLLAIAVVSFVIVRNQQGEGALLVTQQHQAQTLAPAKVAASVRRAPQTANGPSGKSAACVALGTGELHNPWRCTITYPSGLVDQYRVTVNIDGSWTGDDQVVRSHGQSSRPGGSINGCCIAVP